MSDNGTCGAATSHDALIGDIYECVIDPARWPGTVAHVIEAIGGIAGWVAVHRPDRVRSTYQIEVGTDPEWQTKLRESYVPLSPYVGTAHYVSSGDILSVEDVVDYDEFTAGRFYREWAAPQGWPDLLFAVLAREADAFSFLGVCMPHRAGPESKAAAAVLVPHLERALRILDLLDRNERRLDDLEAAVDAMATGVALADRDGALLGINRSAEALLGKMMEMLPDGRKRLRAGSTTRPVHEAIRVCGVQAMGRDGETLLVDTGERSLTILVVPLPPPRSIQTTGAVAALFVSDPACPPSLPPHAIIQRFGLTPSELRVALALLDGSSPTIIAAQHGVSLATVRTHLRRLYEKTGTDGQVALVRIVANSLQGV